MEQNNDLLVDQFIIAEGHSKKLFELLDTMVEEHKIKETLA